MRNTTLAYGRQSIDDSDVRAVTAVLRSDFLTTGPAVEAFEGALAEVAGARHAVAVNSGTAALHAMVYALGIGPGDEVIVPAITFAATANVVVMQGARPVFADVLPDSLLIDPASVEARITPRTRAIIAVDYAGQPCDYDALQQIADEHGLSLAADACHALGASYKTRSAGSLAKATAFSFHPVKHITTGEGGAITTDDPDLARRMRLFRSHGISSDYRDRERHGSWFYEMVDLGFNYRLTDIQCALGTSQLRKLRPWVARRQEIARHYDRAFADLPGLAPLVTACGLSHAYHLYVIKLDLNALKVDRARVFAALRSEGIGVNVHYIPVHLHPFYRERFGTGPGLCPAAEAAYEQIVSLPIFPAMTGSDVRDVTSAVDKVITWYSR